MSLTPPPPPPPTLTRKAPCSLNFYFNIKLLLVFPEAPPVSIFFSSWIFLGFSSAKCVGLFSVRAFSRFWRLIGVARPNDHPNIVGSKITPQISTYQDHVKPTALTWPLSLFLTWSITPESPHPLSTFFFLDFSWIFSWIIFLDLSQRSAWDCSVRAFSWFWKPMGSTRRLRWQGRMK